jgi:hypothetical protein
MKEGRSTFTILTGKRTPGRTRHRWEDNVRIHPKELESTRGIGLI